jgi:hypothetical protein
MPAVSAPREHPAERCRVDGVVAALGRSSPMVLLFRAPDISLEIP